jgi:hypothetical protein
LDPFFSHRLEFLFIRETLKTDLPKPAQTFGMT